MITVKSKMLMVTVAVTVTLGFVGIALWKKLKSNKTTEKKVKYLDDHTSKIMLKKALEEKFGSVEEQGCRIKKMEKVLGLVKRSGSVEERESYIKRLQVYLNQLRYIVPSS